MTIKVDGFWKMLRGQYIRRQHKKRLDRRNIGKNTCSWLLKWGYGIHDGVYKPYILRMIKDGTWKKVSMDVDMRGLKRHNRQAWVLFRFCKMLGQCDQTEFTSIVLMDRKTMNEVMGQYVNKPNKRGTPPNPLPEVVKFAVFPKQFVEKEEKNPKQVFHMELVECRPHHLEIAEKCLKCRMAAVRQKEKRRAEAIDRSWMHYELFSCPHHFFYLSKEPEYKCPYRAEFLVVTQPGSDRLRENQK